MIMINTTGLHMRLILIQPKVDLAALRLIIPGAITVPKLRCPSLKGHAIHRHAKHGMKRGRRCFLRLRIQRHTELILLSRDCMWISLIGKLPNFVIRQAIGLNDALAILLCNADLRCLKRGSNDGNTSHREDK